MSIQLTQHIHFYSTQKFSSASKSTNYFRDEGCVPNITRQYVLHYFFSTPLYGNFNFSNLFCSLKCLLRTNNIRKHAIRNDLDGWNFHLLVKDNKKNTCISAEPVLFSYDQQVWNFTNRSVTLPWKNKASSGVVFNLHNVKKKLLCNFSLHT